MRLSVLLAPALAVTLGLGGCAPAMLGAGGAAALAGPLSDEGPYRYAARQAVSKNKDLTMEVKGERIEASPGANMILDGVSCRAFEVHASEPIDSRDDMYGLGCQDPDTEEWEVKIVKRR